MSEDWAIKATEVLSAVKRVVEANGGVECHQAVCHYDSMEMEMELGSAVIGGMLITILIFNII